MKSLLDRSVKPKALSVPLSLRLGKQLDLARHSSAGGEGSGVRVVEAGVWSVPLTPSPPPPAVTRIQRHLVSPSGGRGGPKLSHHFCLVTRLPWLVGMAMLVAGLSLGRGHAACAADKTAAKS